MRKTTAKLIEEFKATGGAVICLDEISFDANNSSLEAALKGTPNIDRVSISDDKGNEIKSAIYQLRYEKETGRMFVFICDTTQEKRIENITITIPKGYEQVQEWDASTGRGTA